MCLFLHAVPNNEEMYNHDGQTVYDSVRKNADVDVQSGRPWYRNRKGGNFFGGSFDQIMNWQGHVGRGEGQGAYVGMQGHRKLCKYGHTCKRVETGCDFYHGVINKPCKNGESCVMGKACLFLHNKMDVQENVNHTESSQTFKPFRSSVASEDAQWLRPKNLLGRS